MCKFLKGLRLPVRIIKTKKPIPESLRRRIASLRNRRIPVGAGIGKRLEKCIFRTKTANKKQHDRDKDD